MDASRMVEFASNWTTVPEKVTCTIPRLALKRYVRKLLFLHLLNLTTDFLSVAFLEVDLSLIIWLAP